MIANVVRFNTQEFDYYESLSTHTAVTEEEYLITAKLTAILRVANALDRSHKQKFKSAKVLLKEEELLITVDTQEDITLEKSLFPEKAEFLKRYSASVRSSGRRKHL